MGRGWGQVEIISPPRKGEAVRTDNKEGAESCEVSDNSLV
jgi:hypothetical protein